LKKKNLIPLVRRTCSNWKADGTCAGVKFKCPRIPGMTTKIRFELDKELMGKPCKINKDCSFFDAIVVPGLTDKDKALAM
jgi:hypothetical protein